LRLAIQKGPPAVELRLQMKVSGSKANVRVEPCIVDTDGEAISFTTARINTMMKELPVEIRKAESDLTAIRKRKADIQEDINRTGSRLGGNTQANIRLQQLRADLNKANERERLLAGRAQILKHRQSALPNLANLGNQMHNKAQLRVRIFFISGGEEVTVLSM
jgi:hypothetical protein